MSPTGTELESRLRETLRAKADQVSLDDRAFAPDAVPLAEARRRPRTAWLVAAAAFVVVAIAIGVGISLSGSDPSRPERDRPAVGIVDGEPVARLAITALPELRYDPAELTTVPGVNEIQLLDAGGTHTLVFADPALAGARLAVPSGANRVKVDLEPGRDYTFFCIIPGHRAAGMEGVIHVLPEADRSPVPVPPVIAGNEQHLEVVPVPDVVAEVLERPSEQGDVVSGTLFAVSVGGGPGVALYDDANGTLAGRFNRVEAVPFEGTPGVAGVFVREGQAIVASNWPTAGRQTYLWPHLPAGTAFVTYELGGERLWQRPRQSTAGFDVTRPAQFDRQDWRAATPPVLRAYDAQGTLLRQVNAPRMVGDDHEVVIPG